MCSYSEQFACFLRTVKNKQQLSNSAKIVVAAWLCAML